MKHICENVEFCLFGKSVTCLYGCPQGNRLGKISSSSLQGWSSDAFASFWAGDLVLCPTMVIWWVFCLFCFSFPFLFLFCFFCVALCRKYGVFCFRFEGCSQLALTSLGRLPVHFRVLLLLCWLTFPFIRPSFLICYYISPGSMSLLWTSWVRVWGWVSDRVTTDPLFVRMPHAFLHLFSDGREVLGSRLGCFPSWGGLCASFAQWLLPLWSLSRVYISPVSGRLLFCSLWGTVALCVICWGGGGLLFSPSFPPFLFPGWHFFDVYVPSVGYCWWVREPLL